MEDSEVFLAVLRGLSSWGPTEAQIVALAVRVFEQFKRYRILGEFLVPILRGSKVTMGQGVETELRSIHGTVSVPMRARFDPITSWQRRLMHSTLAAELLGEDTGA